MMCQIVIWMHQIAGIFSTSKIKMLNL